MTITLWRVTLDSMCERCAGEPYRGVRALFNGDFQAAAEFADRRDWLIVSPSLIVHIGESALQHAEPLVRVCDMAVAGMRDDEVDALAILGDAMGRPVFCEQ